MFGFKYIPSHKTCLFFWIIRRLEMTISHPILGTDELKRSCPTQTGNNPQ